MRHYLVAAVTSVVFVGFVAAVEFGLQIGSINADGSVTGFKNVLVEGKKGTQLEMVTVKLARDVRVHMGKFVFKAPGLVADGDDLNLAGLKAALLKALDGDVRVLGKVLDENDILKISVHDGKPVTTLNGKEIPFSTVNIREKALLTTRIITSDDGIATTILIHPFSRGFFGLGTKDKN